MVSDRHLFCLCSLLQRDPAEEALKNNNMNLDQAMSKFTRIFVYVFLYVLCKELICDAFAKDDSTNTQLIYYQGIKISQVVLLSNSKYQAIFLSQSPSM